MRMRSKILALLVLLAPLALMAPTGGFPGYPWLTGNQAPVAGSKLKIDHQMQGTPTFPVENEGGIWASTGYAFAASSNTVNASTVAGQGTSGPLIGMFNFLNNNGATAPAVANLSDCVAQVANSICFGANIIARNGAVNGTKLVGLEIDLEPAAATTISANSIGLALNVFSLGATDPTPAIQLGAVAGGTWSNGILTSNVRNYHLANQSGDTVTSLGYLNTVNGHFSNAAILLGTGASQGIDFGGLAFGTSPYMYSDASNNILLNMGSTNFFSIANASGVGIASIAVAGNQFGSPTGGAQGASTLNVAGGLYQNGVQAPYVGSAVVTTAATPSCNVLQNRGTAPTTCVRSSPGIAVSTFTRAYTVAPICVANAQANGAGVATTSTTTTVTTSLFTTSTGVALEGTAQYICTGI